MVVSEETDGHEEGVEEVVPKMVHSDKPLEKAVQRATVDLVGYDMVQCERSVEKPMAKSYHKFVMVFWDPVYHMSIQELLG